MKNRYLELNLKEIPKDKASEPAKTVRALAVFHEVNPQLINAFIEMVQHSEDAIEPFDMGIADSMRQEAIEAINKGTLIGVHKFKTGLTLINIQLIVKEQ